MKKKRMILFPVVVLISLVLLSSTPAYASGTPRRWGATFKGDIEGSGKLSSNDGGIYFSGSFPLRFGSTFGLYAGYHGDSTIMIQRSDETTNRVMVRVDFDFAKTPTGKTYKSLWGWGTIDPTNLRVNVKFIITSKDESYYICEVTVNRKGATSTKKWSGYPNFTISGTEISR